MIPTTGPNHGRLKSHTGMVTFQRSMRKPNLLALVRRVGPKEEEEKKKKKMPVYAMVPCYLLQVELHGFLYRSCRMEILYESTGSWVSRVKHEA